MGWSLPPRPIANMSITLQVQRSYLQSTWHVGTSGIGCWEIRIWRHTCSKGYWLPDISSHFRIHHQLLPDWLAHALPTKEAQSSPKIIFLPIERYFALAWMPISSLALEMHLSTRKEVLTGVQSVARVVFLRKVPPYSKQMVPSFS